MHVEMKNGLPGTRSDVEHGSIAILDAALPRDIGGDELATADHFCILGRGFLQSAQVLLGNDEHMRRSLRINIVEGIYVLVFVDFLGGYFPANDAAEQTVVHDTVHSLEWETRRAVHGHRRDGEGAELLYPIGYRFCSAGSGSRQIDARFNSDSNKLVEFLSQA
jgi:hypothetical protein